jgi:DNA-directed RNA polymerase subunit D
MKIKVLRQRGEYLDFLLEGTTPAFTNALRRVMMSEVPTLAIEKVDMYENDSSLFDEMIAHRLALIPLIFLPDKMSMPHECKCEGKGCPLCNVVFALEKTGPCMVHSGDMKSSNKDVRPTHKTFPIVELSEGQRLRFEAVAQLGMGLNHAKWQAANSSYQYHPDLFIDARVKREKAAELKGDQRYVIDKIAEDTLEPNRKPDTFIFRVESISGLTPHHIVLKSAEILEKKAEQFQLNVKKL